MAGKATNRFAQTENVIKNTYKYWQKGIQKRYGKGIAGDSLNSKFISRLL